MGEILFEGRFVNRSVDASDLSAIATANNRDDVTSIWGSIKDFFCGTKVEAAKLAFYDVIHGESDNRLDSFHDLYKMVSETYRDRFQYQAVDSQTIKVSIKGTDFCQSLPVASRKMTANALDTILEGRLENSSSDVAQLKKDISRSSYNITVGSDVVKYRADDGVDRITKESAVDRFVGDSCNEYQKRILNVLATQCSVLDLAKMGSDADPRFMKFGNDHVMVFDIEKLPSGDIRCDVSYTCMMASESGRFAVYQGVFDVENDANNRGKHKLYGTVEVGASFVIGLDSTDCLNAFHKGTDAP